jgi:hypothetical protein
VSDNKVLIGVALVALFLVGVLVGVFWPSPGGEEVAQVVLEAPDSEYQPWDETLALTSPFPRFIFLPLNNPAVVPADMASFMKDDDIVAGVVVEGQARAYPQWVLVAYHVFNVTIGNSPLLLAHCEICSGTSSFTPMVDAFEGRTMSFQIHGIAKGTFSVYDYQTQTVWSPFTGRTMEGALHPSRMDRIPLIVEPWGDWKKRFPETEVLLATRRMIEVRDHGRGDPNTIGHDFLPDGFAKVANMDDTRLSPNELIFGVTNIEGTQSIVFPLEYLEQQEGLLKYRFADEDYLLKRIGEFAVVAYRLRKTEEEREFHQISETPFRVGDDQGGVWDEFGHTVNEGGEDLLVADGYFTEWYEWVSGWPESQIAD